MRTAYRAAIYHCLADPGRDSAVTATAFHEDGMLVVDEGRIVDVGPAATIAASRARRCHIVTAPPRFSLAGLSTAPGSCRVHSRAGP